MHLQGLDRMPCLRRQTASSPGEAGLRPLAAQSPAGAFRLRSRPRGFEPFYLRKTKRDGKVRLVFFGASSGVRTLDTLIKSHNKNGYFSMVFGIISHSVSRAVY